MGKSVPLETYVMKKNRLTQHEKACIGTLLVEKINRLREVEREYTKLENDKNTQTGKYHSLCAEGFELQMETIPGLVERLVKG